MAVSKPGSPIRKKKENVTVTLSPYLKKQLDVLVDTGDFSSLSDLATMAFSEFLARYNSKKELEKTVNNGQVERTQSEKNTHFEYVE